MPEKFPQYITFRKLVCILLSIASIVVQSGCYSTRVTQSFDQADIHSSQKVQNLEAGQLIRITYKEKKSIKRIEGAIKSINAKSIIITQKPQGKRITIDKLVSLKQIQKVELLDKKLNVVLSVFSGTFHAFWILAIIGILLVDFGD